MFSLVEAVDGRFTDDHFADGDGNLYKEGRPDTDDTEFLDSHLETNQDQPDRLYCNSTTISRRPRTTSCRGRGALSGPDSLFAYLAIDRSIRDWDGASAFYCYEGSTACENHNYYLKNDARYADP